MESSAEREDYGNGIVNEEEEDAFLNSFPKFGATVRWHLYTERIIILFLISSFFLSFEHIFLECPNL